MAQQLSRRDFLRLAAVSGVAAAAGSDLFALEGLGARPVAAQDVVEITYGTPGGVQEDVAWEPVWEAFNEANDSIHANYMAIGGNYGPEYLEKLQALMAGGRAPDVFFVNDGVLVGYVERGVITPLDAYVEANPDVDLDDFFTPHLASHQWKDQLWGLPRDGAPFAMFFNGAIYEEAGVPLPDNELTWDTYLEQAKELTQRDDAGRALVLGANRGQWIDWVWQAEGKVFNEDLTKCTLDEPEAIEGLRFVQELITVHEVAAAPSDLADQSEGDMFTGGRLANYMGARGYLGAMCSANFPFDAVLEPMGKVRASRTNVGPTVIWSGSPNQDEAFELLKFIVSTEGQRLKISSGYAYPSRKSAAAQEWLTDFSCGESLSDGINVTFTQLVENNWAHGWPLHPKWVEISTAINAELDYLWEGAKSAEEVATAITEAVDAILEED